MLSFNTRDKLPCLQGYPAEAKPCRCDDRRLVHDGECLLCGRWPEHVIRTTWARRAAGMTLTGAVSDVPLHGRRAAIDFAGL